MKVSFIIPTRNQGDFLARCIESCLAQRIDDRQILVRDGASTDNTPQVLARFADRITAVSEPDAGQSDALDKAIARADGEVIAWINSDDFYPSDDVLPSVLDAFAGDDQLDIVYGQAMLTDPAGKVIRAYPVKPVPPLSRLLTCPISPLCQPAVFFKRELYHAAGGIDRELHLTMDHDLWLRMLPRARKILMLDKVLAHVTLHPQAKSIDQATAQFRELWRVKRRYVDAYHPGWRQRLDMRLGHWKNLVYAELLRAGLIRR